MSTSRLASKTQGKEFLGSRFREVWFICSVGHRSSTMLSFLIVFLACSSSFVHSSSDCPEGCSCPSQGTIFCVSRQSHVIPPNLPSSVSDLYVFQNGIDTLSPDDFAGLGELRMLDLSQNKLTKVPDGVFGPLVSLQNLDLSNNHIIHISKFSFAGVVHLERLYLHGNGIESIQMEAFNGLEGLLELKLQGNKLTSLPTLRLPALLLLDLSFNYLPDLGPRDLQTPRLESLRVADLGLTNLDSDLMASLGNLHDLDVSENKLEEIPEALKDKRGLITLSLASNPIGELRIEDFQTMVSLQDLNLSELNLQGFPQSFFQLFPKLSQLTVAKNPFNCLCPLAWFPAWLRDSNVNLGRTNETRCHFPLLNAGKVLEELERQDFECSSATTVALDVLKDESTPVPPMPATSPGTTHTNDIPPPPPFPSDEPPSDGTDGENRPPAPPPALPTSVYGDQGDQNHICPPSICLNGGNCRFDHSGQLVCICLRGTTGLYCENLSNHKPPVRPPATPEESASVLAPVLTSDRDDIGSRLVTSTSILVDLHGFMRTRPHIRGIKLTYRNLSGHDRRPMHLNVPASYSEYTLRGLRPNSTYSVCASPLEERVIVGGAGGDGGVSAADAESCMEARTEGGPQSSSLEPRVDDQGQLTHTLIPAMAALALVMGVAVLAGLVLFLRRRRAKAAHAGLEPGETGPMELEGVKICLENGAGGTVVSPTPKGEAIATFDSTVPQNGGTSHPQNGASEYEVPLMQVQGNVPSNNNVATLNPSYF
ncbi:hypothetical protein DPEC_G00172150 [Dallia pectoralis]|uniref:Uncharacterized protein n=1 Tax=Dallia pectoralis TaxID=75939 RepID=A0ACC2GDL8_DALPE|nr:hypothetical protein DPEC_G00172150 [Dallia pectoralis]